MESSDEEYDFQEATSMVDDECTLDWSDTLYLPQPHLITEEAFNSHFSYEKYLDLFTNLETGQEDRNAEKPNDRKAEKHKDSKKSEKQSDDVVNLLYEFHTKYHFSLPQPRVSAISQSDREFYFWFLRNRQRTKNNESHEMRHKTLLRTINQEQNEYQKFLHACSQSNPHEYGFIGQIAQDFVMQRESRETQMLLQSDKRVFALIKTINVTRVQPQPVNVNFEFLKNLQQKEIPPLKIPPCNTSFNTKVQPVIPVMEDDSILLDMCGENEATVCIEERSFLAIMESFVLSQREWLIPLKIERIDGAPGIGKEDCSVIMFGRPYPRREMDIREANLIYYQNVLDEILCSEFTEGNPAVRSNCINLFKCGSHKILVKCRVDCIEKNDTYIMKPKIEMQPYVGFEQFSLRDLCTLWWASKLSNTKTILCARVDPRNHCMRRIDSYARATLCAPGCPYNPESFYSRFSCFLDTLMTCSPGDYLLEHASGNNHFFLFGEKEKGFTTLETKYKDLLTGKRQLVNKEPKISFWLPVDMKIRPSHIPENEIPWIFQIKHYNIEFHALGRKNQRQHFKTQNQKNVHNKKPPNLQKQKSKKKVKSYIHSKPPPPRLNKLTLSDDSESIQPNSEPLPPGIDQDLKSPIFKMPLCYDDDEFGDL